MASDLHAINIMANHSPDESHTSITPPSSAKSPGLQPHPRDAFFGYPEKMKFQQIHGKVLTNRKGSDSHSDVGLNPVSTAGPIYWEEEEDEGQPKQRIAEPHIIGTFCLNSHSPGNLQPFRTNYRH